MGETSWLFLIVGSFAAMGAAMAVGTLAALARYRRTGTFPGSEEQAALSRGKTISLWVRIVVGVVLAVAGIVVIQQAGLI